MDAKKRAAVKYAYEKTHKFLIYIPFVIFFVLLVLIIPLYIQTFKKQKTKDTLFLATEDQQMALEVNNSFVNLTTYYPKDNNSISGKFIVTTTVPGSLTFRVINKESKDITSGVEISGSKASPSIINFSNNIGGEVTIQYTNTNATNYITRIDIFID